MTRCRRVARPSDTTRTGSSNGVPLWYNAPVDDPVHTHAWTHPDPSKQPGFRTSETPVMKGKDFEELMQWIRWLQRLGGLTFAEDEDEAMPLRGKKLIVGLGNPGPEYANTRHNIGFRVVDMLARRWGGRFRPLENALVSSVSIHGVPVVLAKPQTFMNLSGKAVAPLVRRLGLPLEDVLVVYDDMDLPFGTLRLRAKGGHAGHKGMRSILEALGTQAVPRLRFGIGRPPGNMDPADFVLDPFSPEEGQMLPQLLQRAVQAVELWVQEGFPKAAQWLHTTVQET